MSEYVSRELIDAFLECTGRRFLALEERFHLARSLEAVVAGERGMQRVRPEEIGNRFFLLELELAGPDFSVVLTYGDREYDLACTIRANSFERAYSLSEWLAVLGEPERLEEHGGWVLTSARLEKLLARHEELLARILPEVARTGEWVEWRLERQRRELLDAAWERDRKAEHKRLAFRAAEALRRKDFAEVVRALSAVEAELTPGERAKLEYARKQSRH